MTRLLCVVLLLAACGTTGQPTDESGLALQVSPSSPAAGDSITLRLINSSSEPVGYNLCTSALLRQVGDEWLPVPSERICTMELRILQPSDDATFPLTMPDTLGAGLHRFQTRVERMDSGAMADVMSPPFEI